MTRVTCSIWIVAAMTLIHVTPAGWKILLTADLVGLGVGVGFNVNRRMNNCIPSNVQDKVSYPFPNFNGAAVEVLEWIINFIPRFIIDIIAHPC